MADTTHAPPSLLVNERTHVAATREELLASLANLKAEAAPGALAQRALGLSLIHISEPTRPY